MVPFLKKSTSAKIKSLLAITIERLKILKNRLSVVGKQSREDVAQLLRKGQSEKAILRVEHAFREGNMAIAYELLLGCCQLIISRVESIKSRETCPPELKEAFASLIYASPRCGDLKELHEIRDILRTRYPGEFSAQLVDQRPENCVNPQIVQNMSTQSLSHDFRVSLVKQIAIEYKINWNYEEASTSRSKKADSPKASRINRGPAQQHVQKDLKGQDANKNAQPKESQVKLDANMAQQATHSSLVPPNSKEIPSRPVPPNSNGSPSKPWNVQPTEHHYTNIGRDSKTPHPISIPVEDPQLLRNNTPRGRRSDHFPHELQADQHQLNSKDGQNSMIKSHQKKKSNADMEAVEAALVAAAHCTDAATTLLDMVNKHSLRREESNNTNSPRKGQPFSGKDATIIKNPSSQRRPADSCNDNLKNYDGAESKVTKRGSWDDTEHDKEEVKHVLCVSQTPKYDDYASNESDNTELPFYMKPRPRDHRYLAEKSVSPKSKSTSSFTGKDFEHEVPQFDDDDDARPRPTFHNKKLSNHRPVYLNEEEEEDRCTNNRHSQPDEVLPVYKKPVAPKSDTADSIGPKRDALNKPKQANISPFRNIKRTDYSEHVEYETAKAKSNKPSPRVFGGLSHDNYDEEEGITEQYNNYSRNSLNRSKQDGMSSSKLNIKKGSEYSENGSDDLYHNRPNSRTRRSSPFEEEKQEQYTHNYKQKPVSAFNYTAGAKYSDHASDVKDAYEWNVKEEESYGVKHKKKTTDNYGFPYGNVKEDLSPQNYNYTPSKDSASPMMMRENIYQSHPDRYPTHRPVNRKLEWQSSTSEELEEFFNHDEPASHRNRKLRWQSSTSDELDELSSYDDQASVTGAKPGVNSYHPRFDSPPTTRSTITEQVAIKVSNCTSSPYSPINDAEDILARDPPKSSVRSVRTRARRQ